MNVTTYQRAIALMAAGTGAAPTGATGTAAAGTAGSGSGPIAATG